VSAVALITTAAPLVHAEGLLNFETTPAGVAPSDNGVLSTPYAVPGGTARFFFDVNADNVYTSGTDVDPLFEHSGNDSVNGFVSTVPGIHDSARPGFEGQLGSFFLRQPGGFQFDVPGPFVIDYDTTTVIRELSGEIWDIDGTLDRGYEQWRVDVLSASGVVLASQFLPQGFDPSDPATLDSLPWMFALRNLPDGVDKLRLVYVGIRTASGWRSITSARRSQSRSRRHLAPRSGCW
jgi:hypothetical protein